MGTFEEFMREVDREIAKVCGLGHSDLADFLYYDAYESEEDPADVAREVLENEGFPFD